MMAQVKFRLGALLLLIALSPFALFGFVYLLADIVAGDAQRVRWAMRAFDNFGNASALGGHWATTISASSWLNRGRWWGAAIVWLTDQIRPGHCMAEAAMEADLRKYFGLES